MNENELKILVEKMKAGDRESFNLIFRRYYPPLVRFCIRFVGDQDQAAEIVQDHLLLFRVLHVALGTQFRYHLY